jgi:transcriptional regulator with PAS, ATPase and Fis domain
VEDTPRFGSPPEGPAVLSFWDEGHAAASLRDGTPVIVGRAPDADLRIPHASVSRKHARVTLMDGVVRVEDLGSENGTRVRGRALRPGEAVVLHQGELVELGHALVVVRAQGEAQAAPAEASMAEVHRVLDLVAEGTISVTLLGETGVGKERLAERVHERSKRAKRPFVRLNCAALPEPLLESELFGYERGAFTGDTNAKPGLLETAEGGTVFLDEVGDLPLGMQAKVLRVLESKQVLRVGSLKPREIDVRFVAATNRDLEEMVAAGTFRRDLFYRLCGVLVSVPPLRERTEEIEPLARGFFDAARAALGRPPVDWSVAVQTALRAYPWPGNVRELKNAMDAAALLCTGRTLDLAHLPARVREARPEPTIGANAPLSDAFAKVEKDRILQALEQCGGNRTRAAKLLGISRQRLMLRLDEYGVKRPRKGAA